MKAFLLMCALITSGLASARADLKGPDHVVALWDGAPPGSKVDATYAEISGKWDATPPIQNIQQVSQPRVEVYLPAKEKATGAAVVICPGGGYGALAVEHEGADFARWFQERGIAGIVLIYRLPNDRIMEDRKIGPLQDVQQAFRLTRRHASDWGIATNKIGVIGFSAGGHLAGTASTLYREAVYPVADGVSARPDFSILVYGVLSFQDGVTHQGSRNALIGEKPSQALKDHYSNELQVDDQTPPAFLIHAIDDEAVPVGNSIAYYEALRRHKIPTELHLYQAGGHGFGMRGINAHWMVTLEAWLKLNSWCK